MLIFYFQLKNNILSSDGWRRIFFLIWEDVFKSINLTVTAHMWSIEVPKYGDKGMMPSSATLGVENA